MNDWLLALVLKPLIALAVFGLIVLPIKMAFQRWFPAGRVKRLLLTRITKG